MANSAARWAASRSCRGQQQAAQAQDRRQSSQSGCCATPGPHIALLDHARLLDLVLLPQQPLFSQCRVFKHLPASSLGCRSCVMSCNRALAKPSPHTAMLNMTQALCHLLLQCHELLCCCAADCCLILELGHQGLLSLKGGTCSSGLGLKRLNSLALRRKLLIQSILRARGGVSASGVWHCEGARLDKEVVASSCRLGDALGSIVKILQRLLWCAGQIVATEPSTQVSAAHPTAVV